MPEIYDNVNSGPGEALPHTLAGSESLDACVGFFNFRGWKHMAESIEKLPFRQDAPPAVCLLIGMIPGEKEILRAVMRDEEAHRLTNQQAMQLKQQTKAKYDLSRALRGQATR